MSDVRIKDAGFTPVWLFGIYVATASLGYWLKVLHTDVVCSYELPTATSPVERSAMAKQLGCKVYRPEEMP